MSRERYTPADDSKWTPNVHSVDEALDQLAADTGGGAADAHALAFDPTTVGDWPGDVDPGSTGDALDTLAGITDSLVPGAAPVLSQIDYDTAEGPAGVVTWPPNPATGTYVNTPGGVDDEFGTAGTEHGILDATTDVDGDLQPQVAGTLNYVANAFDVPLTGTDKFYLKVNGATILTYDASSGASSAGAFNGNGSGFTSFIARTFVTFDNGDPYENLAYRTCGGWIVKAADLVKGYNEIRVDHETDSGTIQTTIAEIVVDHETAVDTAYPVENLHTPVRTIPLRNLSGITYDQDVTILYDLTANNTYKNTYVKIGAVTIQDIHGNLDSIAAETLAASGGDETKQHVFTNKVLSHKTSVRTIGTGIQVKTTVLRVLPEHGTVQSAGDTEAGLLFDAITTPADTDLIKQFNNELYRYHFGSDFNSKVLAANWDGAQSLVGASADHNDGIQVESSRLVYPMTAYDGFANAAANPDYSSAEGVRHYAQRDEDAVATSAFRVLIDGSFTLVSDATAFPGPGGTDKIKVALRFPTQTGWLDLAVNFSEGSFGSTSEASRFGKDNGDSLTDGCRQLSLDSGSALGVSIGTKTTSNSGDRFYLRIIFDDNWSGNITKITVTWNAS